MGWAVKVCSHCQVKIAVLRAAPTVTPVAQEDEISAVMEVVESLVAEEVQQSARVLAK